MGKQSVFDYARIAAEAEGKLLRHFDPDVELEERGRSGDSDSGGSEAEDPDVQASGSLMAFSTLGQSYMRNYGDPLDPSAFLRTL